MLLRRLAVRLSVQLRTDAVRLYEASSLADLQAWTEALKDG